MEQGYGSVDCVQCPQHRQRDGVVAAYGDEALVLADQWPGLLFDFTNSPSDVVGGAGDVAGIDYLGFLDSGGTEPWAGAEGGGAVVGHSDDGNVIVGHAVDLREPGKVPRPA